MSNANRAIPEYEIEVAGKTYKVKFTLGLLAFLEQEWERRFKVKVNFYNPAFLNQLNITQTLVLIWALIRKHEPNLTPEDLGEMLSLADIESVGDALSNLIVASAPEPKKEPESEQQGKENSQLP